eukprot:CAMPEP_0180099132 /NCGR_PEP_ID=MMETSP0985-20121206/28140_1 /TAXON_ID=483367 /ORGANISM="non described non described, Strain CCMP 2436" /LENGTH=111 /DNA_ID=CAMNT_0022034657 /DNA_START=137 /DNA_END=470 /DNA_ORIENTATION=-
MGVPLIFTRPFTIDLEAVELFVRHLICSRSDEGSAFEYSFLVEINVLVLESSTSYTTSSMLAAVLRLWSWSPVLCLQQHKVLVVEEGPVVAVEVYRCPEDARGDLVDRRLV